MHKSQLNGFIIDCQGVELQTAAEFWGAALGLRLEKLAGSANEAYVKLNDPGSELHIEVQKVDHPSRVHLDIETDDVEAEVSRLEKLGARRVSQVRTWWVMEAPTGHRFCVVKAGSPSFATTARQWP